MTDSYYQKTDSGWGDSMNKKDRVVYMSKGVFNYGKWIRLNNPKDNNEEGEVKDLNVNIRDVGILKYGSGLLFQLPRDKDIIKKVKANDHDYDNKDNKIKGDNKKKKKGEKKLTKKEKKLLDMKKHQRSIEDSW